MNKKVKWGVLGTAGIAKNWTIPGMMEAVNCELYAVAGRDLKKAEVFQSDFGFEKAYGSYEEMLADQELEAVYIPLPNELHYEWTIKALNAGKHVLCEKPLAPTTEQIKEMFHCAQKNGVLLMEAFAYLHSPYIQAVKQEVESGAIGEIVFMESSFLTSGYNQSNIRMRKETFGGCTYDLGCYTTSQILTIMGEEPESIKAVAEFSDQGVDILTSGIMKFAKGAKASFSCGMILGVELGNRVDRMLIYGTKGNIKSDTMFNQDGETQYSITTGGVEVIRKVNAPQNYRLEIEQLGHCIIDGEEPAVPESFSMANGRMLERILRQIGY